jgi:hypothetical protein
VFKSIVILITILFSILSNCQLYANNTNSIETIFFVLESESKFWLKNSREQESIIKNIYSKDTITTRGPFAEEFNKKNDFKIILLPSVINPERSTPKLSNNYEIIVSFLLLDSNENPLKLITIGDADVRKIVINNGETPIHQWEMPPNPNREYFCRLYLEHLYEKKIPNFTRCETIVEFPGNKVNKRNFIWHKSFEGYKVEFLPLPYLWFPAMLYCTNFKNNENGIPIAALPLGIAIGGKWYPFHDRKFVGFSINMSWVLKPDNSLDSENYDLLILSTLSMGGFIDISGLLYLGGAYIWDFRDKEENPGWAMVIGIGPDLLNFLK